MVCQVEIELREDLELFVCLFCGEGGIIIVCEEGFWSKVGCSFKFVKCVICEDVDIGMCVCIIEMGIVNCYVFG